MCLVGEYYFSWGILTGILRWGKVSQLLQLTADEGRKEGNGEREGRRERGTKGLSAPHPHQDLNFWELRGAGG
jgi:hypothetical protein